MPKLTRSKSAPVLLTRPPEDFSVSESELDEIEQVEGNGVEQEKLDGEKEAGSVEDSGHTPILDMLMNPPGPPPPAQGLPPPPPAPVREQAQDIGEKVLDTGDPEKVGEKALQQSNQPQALVDKAEKEAHEDTREDGDEGLGEATEILFHTSDPEEVPDVPIEQTAQEMDKEEEAPERRRKKKRSRSHRKKRPAVPTEQAPPPPTRARRGSSNAPPPPPTRARRGSSNAPPPPPTRARRGSSNAPPPSPPPPPPGVSPLNAPRVRAKKSSGAAEKGEVDTPSGWDVAGEALEVTGNAGDFTALFGNAGKENTGHNAVGTLGGWGQDSQGHDLRSDAHVSGSGDMGAGVSQMGGGLVGMAGGFERMKKGEDKAEKAQGALEAGSGTLNIFSGEIKTLAGAIDAASGNTNNTVDTKVAGDSLGVAADSLALGAKVVENGRNLRKFTGPKRKTWKEASKSTRAKRVGNAIQRVADVGATTTKIGNNIGKLAQQGAGAITTAPNVVGQYVLAPVGLAMSTYEMGKNTASMVKAGRNRTRLTKQMGNFATATDAGTGRQVIDDREADQMQMLEHLHYINQKRQKRAGLNMATNAMSAAGSAMTLSGMGAVGGLAAGAAAGATKLGALAVRKGKQHGRDKKAKRLEKYRDLEAQGDLSEKKQKKLRSMDKDEKKHRYQALRARAKENRLTAGEMQTLKDLARDLSGNPNLQDPINDFKLSKRQRVSLAFRFDTTRSSDEKKNKNLQTAETMLQLWKDVEEGERDPRKYDEIKAARWKAARTGMGVDSKKWAHIVRVKGDDDQELLKEILKQMGKRE